MKNENENENENENGKSTLKSIIYKDCNKCKQKKVPHRRQENYKNSLLICEGCEDLQITNENENLRQENYKKRFKMKEKTNLNFSHERDLYRWKYKIGKNSISIILSDICTGFTEGYFEVLVSWEKYPLNNIDFEGVNKLIKEFWRRVNIDIKRGLK